MPAWEHRNWRSPGSVWAREDGCETEWMNRRWLRPCSGPSIWAPDRHGPLYGFGRAEEIIGKALAESRNRNRVIIATKAGLERDTRRRMGWCNASRKRILEEIKQSLRRLRTDWIDLYQIHWPDPETPVEETAETLLLLYEKGRDPDRRRQQFPSGTNGGAAKGRPPPHKPTAAPSVPAAFSQNVFPSLPPAWHPNAHLGNPGQRAAHRKIFRQCRLSRKRWPPL